MNLAGLFGGGDWNKKVQGASPMLMAMGSHLMTAPGQRDPRTLQIGLAQMMEMQEAKKREVQQQQLRQAIGGPPIAAQPGMHQGQPQMQGGGLLQQAVQSGKLSPELAKLAGLMEPEQAMSLLAQAMGPQEPKEQKRYEVGGALVDESGNEIYRAPEEAEKSSEIIREARELYPNDPQAQRQHVLDYRKRSGVNVNVDAGSNGPQFGTIPAGHKLEETADGWLMTPIKGSPAANEVEAAAAQAGEKRTQTERYGDVVLEDIGRVMAKAQEAPMTTTGIGGAVLQNVPGTGAFDMSKQLTTVKANIGFDRLQQMRAASPTGGALGAVSDRENEMLQSTLGNLEQSQSNEEFIQNLGRLEDVYLKIVHGNVEQKQRIDGRLMIKVGGEWYEAGEVITPALINAVIRQESGGNPRAYNRGSGASGLMQVMPGTARDPGFGVQPLDWSKRFDPHESFRFGTQYLDAMDKRYKGDTPRTLAAYNWGPGNADKWDGRPESLPEETLGYVQNVMAMAQTGGEVQMAGGNDATGGLKKITDPELLKRLEGGDRPQSGLRKITDPALLKRLEGGEQPATVETPDGPQPGQVLDAPPQLDALGVITGGASQGWPEWMQKPARNAATGAVKGATANFSDEIEGLASAATGGSYDRGRLQANVRQAEAQRQNPKLSLAGEIGGALGAAGSAGAGLVGRVAGAIPKTLAGAAEGAGFGALYAAGGADPGQRGNAAVEGAAGGAVLGAAGTRAGIGLQRYMRARQAARAAPGADALKDSARQLFDAAGQSGVIYQPQAVSGAIEDISVKMADALIDPTLHPNASAIMKRLPELLNKPATLKEVERYRQLASGAARSAQPGSADQRLATMIVEAVDDFSIDQSNMVVTSGGAEMQKQARQLWHQFKKDELVAFQVEKAMRNAKATGSGGNQNNTIRQGIKQVLNNKKSRQGFTPEELAAMEKIVEGGSLDGILRLAGKLSPSGNGLMLFLQGAGGVASGGATIPLAIAGHGAKLLSDTATTRRVQALGAMIRAGGNPPHGLVAQLSRPEREALARLVSAQAGQTVGGPMTEGARSLEAAGRTP